MVWNLKGLLRDFKSDIIQDILSIELIGIHKPIWVIKDLWWNNWFGKSRLYMARQYAYNPVKSFLLPSSCLGKRKKLNY